SVEKTETFLLIKMTFTIQISSSIHVTVTATYLASFIRTWKPSLFIFYRLYTVSFKSFLSYNILQTFKSKVSTYYFFLSTTRSNTSFNGSAHRSLVLSSQSHCY